MRPVSRRSRRRDVRAADCLQGIPGRAWLGEVSSVVLQQALADVNGAYRNFFASANGKRKGPKAGRPGSGLARTPGSRSGSPLTRGSRFWTTGGCGCRRSGTWPSAGPATACRAVVGHGDPRRGRPVLRLVRGRGSPEPLPETDAECGIDLGLGHFAVLDDGTKVSAPRFLRRAEKKLKKAQKDLSRKQKGSANREKARVKVARAHAQGRRRAPGLPPQALHGHHPREPSGVRGGPCGGGTGAHEAGEVGS